MSQEKDFFDNCTKNEDKERIKRINEDFLNAFCELKDLPSAVSIFGSARIPSRSSAKTSSAWCFNATTSK